ncbi:hypothetical protein EJ04DRAFT_9418 [Polyplosphaeria fusca]|uniref:Uncharacterized protein n=1 Tax=Polyplosphaeria fusca TaxID=682080 RepID=A0A9P4R9V4_9PLEO|nr:hypothetical protein EJ04DRAFT_9418 [Polyplosphaeria fusca]
MIDEDHRNLGRCACPCINDQFHVPNILPPHHRLVLHVAFLRIEGQASQNVGFPLYHSQEQGTRHGDSDRHCICCFRAFGGMRDQLQRTQHQSHRAPRAAPDALGPSKLALLEATDPDGSAGSHGSHGEQASPSFSLGNLGRGECTRRGIRPTDRPTAAAAAVPYDPCAVVSCPQTTKHTHLAREKEKKGGSHTNHHRESQSKGSTADEARRDPEPENSVMFPSVAQV